ncbi:MFS transporter [Pseudomonas sp. NPDC089407]|uniref:MFS transporter n=1 Tax=Pseudomonas sp. NPDC089407 TaxID=3364464 RepID=UPI00384AA974
MTPPVSATRAVDSFYSSFLLLGILLIAANLRAPITSLGPVLSDVQLYFALTPTTAGLLNALPLLIFACGSPLAPILTKHIGLERALFVSLCLIGMGGLIRSSGLVSALWFGTALIAAGIALANVLVVPLVKRDFPHHTALCVGLYASTMALMAAVASGLAAPLAQISDYGWRVSLGAWSLLSIVAGICWLPNLKSAVPTPAGKHINPQSSPWKSGIGWQVSMFMALQTMTFYTLIDWYPAMASSSGVGASQAGTHLFAYQAAAVLANIGTSAAIRKFSDQRGLGLICSIAILVGVVGLMFDPSKSLLWLLFAGVGAGMSMVTCLTLFGLRTRDHHQAASLSAMAQCVGYGLGASGPFLAGWFHDIFGSWQAPLFLLMAAAALQIVFAVMAGRNRYV